MNCGHEALDNAELVVDDFCQRSQAVRGAGSVGNNLHVRGVFVVVYTHNEHGSIGGRSRNDDLLRAARKVSGSFLRGGESAGGFDDIISAALAPLDVRRIHLCENLDLFAIDDNRAVFCRSFALETAMHRDVYKRQL